MNNSDLISSIKVRAAVPENQADWSDQAILNVATECLKEILVPLIQASKEEHFVFEKHYSVVSGQAKYRLPSRAIGGTIRDVRMLRGVSILPLPQINREEITTIQNGIPDSFYIQSNYLVLYPTPSSSGDLVQCPFFIRPNKLTEVSNGVQVSSIDLLTNTITVNEVPTQFVVGAKLDFIKGSSPYEHLAIDQVIQVATSTTLTFSSVPQDIEVGDWLCLAETSCVPQIPEDFIGVLAQATAVKILESLGQVDGMQAAQNKLEEALAAASTYLSPRVVGEPRRFTTTLI